MIALEAFVSSISYVALAVLAGQIFTAAFLLPHGEPKEIQRSLLIWALVSTLVFLVVALPGLFIQGVKLRPGVPSSELLWRYLTTAQSGKVWLAREAYAALLVIMMWRLARSQAKPRSIRLLAVLTAPLIASRSLMSHAAALREGAALAITADAIHLLATGLWAGGLIALWRTLSLGTKQWQQPVSWTIEVVGRFSLLALVSVAFILATGFYQSSIHVGSFAALLNTNYGKTLLLKLSLFLVMAGLGALNLFSTKPSLRRLARRDQDAPSLRQAASRRIGLESFVGVLIFGATGLLTVLPPGVHAVHQAAAAQPLSAALTGDDKTQRLQPPEGAKVKIRSPAPHQVVMGDSVPLNFELTRGKRGHHVHAYVDGELMGMFESEQGTLNGVAPGRHTLELRVVAEDHRTELDAKDRVEFIVK